jgi:hypothetical protein
MKRLLTVLCLLPLAALAQSPKPGISFSHHDWSLTCDNTRTCRADGYHSDDAEDGQRLSVLLTRAAGPNAPVTAKLELADEPLSSAQAGKQGRKQIALAFSINGKSHGNVAVDLGGGGGVFNAQQIAALLAALPGSAKIKFRDGEQLWRISDKGAAAVLLKMDEAQGRIGTPGAIVRKGERDERGVLPPLDAPKVQAVAFERNAAAEKAFLNQHHAALYKALADSVKGDQQCTRHKDDHAGDARKVLQVLRINARTILVGMPCWLAAYNYGTGYWIVNAAPPFQPVLVTDSATDLGDDGSISAHHKGRGIGDCWGTRKWQWDGKQFLQTEDRHTGQCKLMSGRTWELPSLVTEVLPPKAGGK